MKAMILAAGKGRRVQPLTYELPKPMIPILGKPVMAYLIEYLAKYDVREIMVNVSHLHEKIEEYFGNGHQYGVQIGYSFEGYVNDDGQVMAEPLGSAGGMKKIQEFGHFFDDTTIVLCGDALIDFDLRAALAEHKKNKAIASVITKTVPRNRVSDYGIVVTDEDGRVKSFQEKPQPEAALSNLASTGIYLFEPEVLDLIPADTFFDIGSELFPLLTERGLPFYAQTRDFNWIDIGTVSDYWNVLQDVLSGDIAHMHVPGEQIRDKVWAGLNTNIDWEGTTIEGPVYIGSGCRIEAGCHIVGPTWIGHGSHLCSGVKLERSALFEYTRLLPETSLNEVVVFKRHMVNRQGEISELPETGHADWGNARDRRIERRPEVFAPVKLMTA